MKRIFQLLLLVALAGTPLYGQTVRNFTLNSTTQTGPIVDLRGTGVFVHSFTWSTNATVSAGTCSLVGGSDGVTFGTTIIAAETVTSSGGPATQAVSNANYVRITCAAPNTPIAGNGSVQFRYVGNASATAVGADVNVTNSPLTIAGAVTNAGTFATQIVQGGNTATVRNLTANDALNVALVDANGDHLVNVGGGTQYEEATVDATITGNALMFEAAGNTVVAAVGTVANGLLVDVSRVTGTVTVSGTVTANLSATDNAVLDDIADGIATSSTVVALPNEGQQTMANSISVAIASNQSAISMDCSNCGASPTETDDAPFTVATDVVVMMGAFYQASPDSVNDGDAGAVRMTIDRKLLVNVDNLADDAAEDAAVATDPLPIGGVYRTASVTLDNGDVGYPRIDVDANLQIVGTGTAGSAAGGVLSVQGVASMTPLLSRPQAFTSGGATIGSFLADNTNTEVIAKASAGQLYGVTVTNKLAAPMYVRAYNSTNPDCTSATGIVGRWIVPAAADSSGGGYVDNIAVGAVFSTGISFCVTTTVSDTNNTAIGTGNAAVTYYYN